MFGRGFVAKEMELSRSTARAKRSCCEKGYVTDAFASMMSEGEVRSADPIKEELQGFVRFVVLDHLDPCGHGVVLVSYSLRKKA